MFKSAKTWLDAFIMGADLFSKVAVVLLSSSFNCALSPFNLATIPTIPGKPFAWEIFYGYKICSKANIKEHLIARIPCATSGAYTYNILTYILILILQHKKQESRRE